MKNPYLPAAAVAALIALALGFWATMGSTPASPTGEVPSQESPTDEGASGEENPNPAGEAVVPTPTGTGVVVQNQILLKNFSDTKWHFAVAYDATWEAAVTRAEDGDVEQFSLEASDGYVLVSRQTPIAEPAGLQSSVSKRTIAGQEVEVRRYSKPNEKYAYYLYFTLVSGNYEYHVSIKSIDATSAFSDSVIRRISPR